MKILKEKLDSLIEKKFIQDFKFELKKLKSVYPFNELEYTMSYLLSKGGITFEEYKELRESYVKRNTYLPTYEMAPRTFGETWGELHLKKIELELKTPKKSIDKNYTGQYDLYLPHNGKNIKIEVKASRVASKILNKKKQKKKSLIERALLLEDNDDYLMNFQQLKPSCCDVFIWLAVYKNHIKYWVLKNDIVKTHKDFGPQHRNKDTDRREVGYKKSEIFEGQIMITNNNVESLNKYLVNPKNLKEAIIKQFNTL